MKRGRTILKLRKGITVVEIVTSLAILSIMSMLAIGVFSMSIHGERVTDHEFRAQSDIRFILDSISHNIRYSTAVFIMPESSFNGANIDTSLEFIPYTAGGFLSERWNYYGIIDNKILSYRWQESPAGHRRIIKADIYDEDGEVDLELRFSQIDATDMDDTLVEFQLVVTRDGVDDPLIDILTAADSLNAMQVVDWSSNVSPGRAIAYRGDDLPREVPIARVAVILDVSGSMDISDVTMPDGSVVSRLTALQRSILDQGGLFDVLGGLPYLEVSIILYSNTANFGAVSHLSSGRPNFNEYMRTKNRVFAGVDTHLPIGGTHTFVPLADHITDLRRIIEIMPVIGGTNIADGLRRTYFAFLDQPPPADGRDVRNFVVFMTDGEPNMAPMVWWNTAPTTWAQEVADRESRFLLRNIPGAAHDLDLPTNDHGQPWSNPLSRYSFPGSLVNPPTVQNPGFPLALDWDQNHQSVANRYIIQPANAFFADMILRDITNNVYFVALSGNVVDLTRPSGLTPPIEALSNALNITTPYTALNFQELFDAFSDIGQSIVTEMWHAAGPNLLPPAGGP